MLRATEHDENLFVKIKLGKTRSAPPTWLEIYSVQSEGFCYNTFVQQKDHLLLLLDRTDLASAAVQKADVSMRAEERGVDFTLSRVNGLVLK